ncbi:hypothetical protein ACFLVH_03030 [Chloroflexota bacterium]
MSDMKSAQEIAMEKIAKLGEATDEERLKWKYVPEGEQLAVRYLKEDCNLVTELSKYQQNVRKYIVEGAAEILIRNLNLPENDAIKKNNRRVMDGLKALKNDKVSVENVYSRIRNIFNHYDEQGEQQRKAAYESLKAEFETKVQQQVQQQLGMMMPMKIDVERQPQFQQEWRKIQQQLDSQYINLLNEYTRELAAIA